MVQSYPSWDKAIDGHNDIYENKIKFNYILDSVWRNTKNNIVKGSDEKKEKINIINHKEKHLYLKTIPKTDITNEEYNKLLIQFKLDNKGFPLPNPSDKYITIRTDILPDATSATDDMNKLNFNHLEETYSSWEEAKEGHKSIYDMALVNYFK